MRLPDNIQPQAEDLGLLCGIEEVELSYLVDTLFYAKKTVNFWWASSCDYHWNLSLKASFLRAMMSLLHIYLYKTFKTLPGVFLDLR